MHGVHRKQRGDRKPQIFYQCHNAPLNPGYDPNCPHPAVRQDRLESFVIESLRTHLMRTNTAERIREAISRAKNRKTKQTTSDERKLAAVRQKIERGTENLALADRENFEAISNLISRWRDEGAALIDRVQRRTTELDPLPEAIDVIERLGELFSKLKKADRLKLADAVRRTVVSTVDRRATEQVKCQSRPTKDLARDQRTRVDDVVATLEDLYAETAKPVSSRQIGDVAGMQPHQTLAYLHEAKDAGRANPVPTNNPNWTKGWVPGSFDLPASPLEHGAKLVAATVSSTSCSIGVCFGKRVSISLRASEGVYGSTIWGE